MCERRTAFCEESGEGGGVRGQEEGEEREEDEGKRADEEGGRKVKRGHT